MINFSIKRRDDAGNWKHLNVGEYGGKTLGEFFLAADGQEVVAEFNIDGKRCFFCGTTHWLERMQKKGPAVLFAEAHARLKDTRPALLQEVIPLADQVADVFGGRVESVAVHY